MLKKDNRYNDWISIGSDIKKIRELWESTSETSLPILVTGEPGTGKSFWIRQSYRIRNLDLKAILDLNFVNKTQSSQSLEKLKNIHTNSKLQAVSISEITKATHEEILFLTHWWKEQKYSEKKPLYLYWELSSKEQTLLHENEAFKDFYDQLKSFRFELPPLRKRVSDLPIFISYFIAEASNTLRKKVQFAEEDLYGFLRNKEFTNNLNELRDFIFALVGFSNGKTLRWKQIPLHFFTNETISYPITPGVPMDTYEKEIIKANLLFTKGNREKTAKLLGISERNLYRKIHDYQLEDFS
ncbi:MAG: transcriptional regulator [Leptospira sp.]|nr:transcriptional regulator [Leptospira sp.]